MSAQQESDDEFRKRIVDAMPHWGALMGVVIESSGSALDEIGKRYGITRNNEKETS